MCRIGRIRKDNKKTGFFFLHPAYPAHPVLTLCLSNFCPIQRR
jgi:hypothetical protein